MWDKASSGLVLPTDMTKIGVFEGTPRAFYTDAMQMLREFNSPEMNDNSDALLVLELGLDMRTDKQVGSIWTISVSSSTALKL